MVLELEEVMDILKDSNLTKDEAIELANKLEVISSHIIDGILGELDNNEK